jgi:hypothetical protein
VILTHLVRCGFCRDLLAHSRRHRDVALLAAADRLAVEHATNNAERMAFGHVDERRSKASAVTLSCAIRRRSPIR